MINYRDKREMTEMRETQTNRAGPTGCQTQSKSINYPLFKIAGGLGMVAPVSNPRLNSCSDSGQPGLV